MEEEAAYYSNVITITNRNRNVLTVIQKVICGFYEVWFRLLQSGPDFMEKYLLCRLLKINGAVFAGQCRFRPFTYLP